jgi:hypothetical protein
MLEYQYEYHTVTVCKSYRQTQKGQNGLTEATVCKMRRQGSYSRYVKYTLFIYLPYISKKDSFIPVFMGVLKLSRYDVFIFWLDEFLKER